MRANHDDGPRIVTAGPRDIERSLDFAESLARRDPRQIPPLRAPLAAQLEGRGAFGRYGRTRLFQALEGDRVVGHLAALINPRLTDSTGAPIGQLGHFEAIDDDGVASGLLEAACVWLAVEGAQEAWGPMAGGAHKTHRLMTDGFERDPFLFEPRNPSHYVRFFESAGFTPRHTWWSYDLSMAEIDRALREELKIDRLARRARRRYTIETLDPAAGVATLRRIHDMLDRAWEGHVGYATLDFDEFCEGYAGILSLLESWQLPVLVDRTTGADVGFGLTFPDRADEVRALAGDASGWGEWKSTRPNRLIWHTIAVAPEARTTGGPFLMMEHNLERALEAGYEEVTIAVVTETFRLFDRIARPTRGYALFTRPLALGAVRPQPRIGSPTATVPSAVASIA